MITPISFVAIDKNPVAGEKIFRLVHHRDHSIQECPQLRQETIRQIAGLAANTRIAGGETRTRELFAQVVDFFPLLERVKKYRHRPRIHRECAHPEQMRGNAAPGSQQSARIAFPRGGNSQPMSFSTAMA